MAASVGLAMNPPHTTEERAVFTQLKPVRMSGADGAEEASVFEDVKPEVRISADLPGGFPVNGRTGLPGSHLARYSLSVAIHLLYLLFK